MTKFFEDLSALRVDPMATAPTVSEILTKVPVTKPNKHQFFRINPNPDFSLNTFIFRDK